MTLLKHYKNHANWWIPRGRFRSRSDFFELRLQSLAICDFEQRAWLIQEQAREPHLNPEIGIYVLGLSVEPERERESSHKPVGSDVDGDLLVKQYVLSGPLRLRVQSRSRARLRIAASIAFLLRASFKGVWDTIAPLSRG